MLLRLIALSIIYAIISGCSYFVSWDSSARSWIGRKISEFVDLNGQPASVKRVDQWIEEYKFEFRKLDPTCVHYWLVNESGIIVDYRYEGRCRVIG